MARMLYLGDDVTLPGDGYPPLAAFQIPFADDLLGAFFLGGGGKIGLRDWAGNADPEAVGYPTFGEGFATLSEDGYLQTDIDEPLELTYVVVGREVSASGVGWIGNFVGGANIGVSLYSQPGGTTMQANAGRVGGVGGSVSVTSDTEDWGIYSLSVPSTGAMAIRNWTTGNGGMSSATAAREINGGGPLRIGRLYSPAHVGEADMAVVLVYDIALDDTQAAIVAAFCRDYAASRGITVGLA